MKRIIRQIRLDGDSSLSIEVAKPTNDPTRADVDYLSFCSIQEINEYAGLLSDLATRLTDSGLLVERPAGVTTSM